MALTSNASTCITPQLQARLSPSDNNFTMRLGETFGFSSSDYIEKISDPSYTLQEIALNIYKKRRAIAMSTVQVAGGILASTISGGVTLAGSAFAARNINVEKRKLKLLEEEWEGNRRQYPLPKRHVKDTVIPVIIATAVGALAFTVDLGLSNAVAQNEMYPIGHPFHYPYDITQVGIYYTAVERGAQAIGTFVMNKTDRAPEGLDDHRSEKSSHSHGHSHRHSHHYRSDSRPHSSHSHGHSRTQSHSYRSDEKYRY
ncbi:hypothetical protein ONZ45_g14818 [Pleurotus djamor]|nr:hypothetical protein ONZ45_g14818 [Pleurotus djamor]